MTRSLRWWTAALLLVGWAAAAASAAGKKELEYQGATVELLRDEWGVPHVRSADAAAVYFGQGYACAEDRLEQLERYRLDATGRMAEFLGPRFVGHDEEVRRDFYSAAEYQRMWEQAPPKVQAAVQAFCAGVNARLTEIRTRAELDWPAGLREAGYEPAPFTPTDTIAIGAVFSRRFGGTGDVELEVEQLYRALAARYGDEARAVLDDLIWKNDPRAPTTANDAAERPVPLGFPEARTIAPEAAPLPGDDFRAPAAPAGENEGQGARGKGQGDGRGALRAPKARGSAPRPPSSPKPQAPSLPPAPADAAWRGGAAAALADAHEAQRALLEREGLPWKLGSNAWVVAPSKSANGRAMLFGGPMMGFRTPQIAHEIHLVAPGLNVRGMTFAGIPGVLIGMNEHLGWTTTTGAGDVIDYFLEEIDPENKHRYKFQGEWRDMEVREEVIKVKGGEARTVKVYRTVHGPVERWLDDRHQAISCARSFWLREFEGLQGLFEANYATTLAEFGAGILQLSTNHNWFVATKQGEIGWWFGGRFPRRHPEQDPRFLTPGDGSREWQGFLTVAELPKKINPPEGFLGNWNNKPRRDWDWMFMGEMFWGHEIYERLRRTPKLTFNDVAQIAYRTGTDVYYACYLKPFLRDAFLLAPDDLSPLERRALDEVLAWDHHEHEGSVGMTVFMKWMDRMKHMVFDEQIGPGAGRDEVMSLLLHALDGAHAGVPVGRDYLGGNAPRFVRRRFHEAVAELEQERGADPAGWGHRRDRINFDPQPPIPRARRGTYMQIIEVGEGYAHGENALPPGQSEDPASPHFGDQRELFRRWQYKPMLLDWDAIERRLGLR